jgi:glycosyltransferase involved in cell wall biosynthesis
MELGKPKLSVVVPVSGDPERIKGLGLWFEETESINIEFIVVEDNLMPRTRAELDTQLSQIPEGFSLKRISGNFGNPGDARNAGLLESTGDWLTFWDSDDLPRVTTVAAILSEPSINGFDYFYTDFLLSDHDYSNLKQNKFASQIPVVNLALVALEPGLWRFYFKSKMLQSSRFSSLLMGEDQLFLSNLELHKLKGKYFQQNSYIYRKGSPGQLTMNSNRIAFLETAIYEQLFSIKRNDSKFRRITIIRQSLSLLRTGENKYKRSGFKVVFKMLFVHKAWRELLFVISQEIRKASR